MRDRRAATAAICLLLCYGTATAALSATPIGYFDTIDGDGLASGWAVDPDAPDQSIEVELYIDGFPGSAAPAVRVDAEAPRPDVNAARRVTGNHGFAALVPTAFRDGKPRRIYAYAVSTDGKSAQLQGSPKPFKLSSPSRPPAKGDASISLNGITIATAARFGGAIASLRWNGKEFVDTQDHGREIQTAWQGNNAGECFNPTEAGSAADAIGLDTTSKLMTITATAASIRTVSHTAFWLSPGQTGVFCGFQPAQPSLWDGGTAVNRTPFSSSTLTKTVTIGYGDMANVVVYDSEITFATDELSYFPLRFIMIENPAAYVRHEFSQMHRYDPMTSRLVSHAEIHTHLAEFSPLPVIAATADGEHAIGLYTADIPLTGFPGVEQQKFSGYGYTDWGPVISINARIAALPASGTTFSAGTYRYRTFLAFGRLSDVTASLQRLAALALSPGQR